MADNFDQATVSPSLPAILFSEDELRSLENACGLTHHPDGDQLYFFAETSFCEEGEDDEGPVNCLAVMQAKLRQLDPVAYPHVSIQGASLCSKMRPDEFGGFAHLVTRDIIRSMSTWQWLHEQAQLAASAGASASLTREARPLRPYSVLLLYPDYANDGGTDTYYAFVKASDSLEAVVTAQRQAAAAQEGMDIEPDDFAPLLATEGHHRGEPLFNK